MGLIIISFAQEYGIRLMTQDLALPEFLLLLGGLGNNTALGLAITARSEKTPTVIQNFSPWQKEQRAKWRKRTSVTKTKDWHGDISQIQKGLEAAFG